MTQSKTHELDNFCQVLIQGLNTMKRANEIPPYLTAKSRDINAVQIMKMLKESLEDVTVLQQFKAIESNRKICSEENHRTKGSIIELAREVKPYIDRIKSANFKLMLERFNAAHEFAIKLSELLTEELGVVEQTS